MTLELAIHVFETNGIELALGECFRDLDGAQRAALGTRIDEAFQLGKRLEMPRKDHDVPLLLATADPFKNRRRDLIAAREKVWLVRVLGDLAIR
jgi:hypothetical protein